ncbi:hypothetical protein L2E82_34848 [Cichorium intybus]|uniref:Uncharacterized protein n=1 Tax=Cichorium intybus TaxID=13427 RepID=A0ACB9BMX1_CICIN|nr:hypothetical protein L2E82_34848 [Cichorium intybus]
MVQASLHKVQVTLSAASSPNGLLLRLLLLRCFFSKRAKVFYCSGCFLSTTISGKGIDSSTASKEIYKKKKLYIQSKRSYENVTENGFVKEQYRSVMPIGSSGDGLFDSALQTDADDEVASLSDDPPEGAGSPRSGSRQPTMLPKMVDGMVEDDDSSDDSDSEDDVTDGDDDVTAEIKMDAAPSLAGDDRLMINSAYQGRETVPTLTCDSSIPDKGDSGSDLSPTLPNFSFLSNVTVKPMLSTITEKNSKSVKLNPTTSNNLSSFEGLIGNYTLNRGDKDVVGIGNYENVDFHLPVNGTCVPRDAFCPPYALNVYDSPSRFAGSSCSSPKKVLSSHPIHSILGPALLTSTSLMGPHPKPISLQKIASKSSSSKPTKVNLPKNHQFNDTRMKLGNKSFLSNSSPQAHVNNVHGLLLKASPPILNANEKINVDLNSK